MTMEDDDALHPEPLPEEEQLLNELRTELRQLVVEYSGPKSDPGLAQKLAHLNATFDRFVEALTAE